MTFWTSSLVHRGRKPHRCTCCRRVIPVGASSRIEAGLYEGDFQSHRLCLPCHAFIERQFKNGELERGEPFEYDWLPSIARDAGEPWPPQPQPE